MNKNNVWLITAKTNLHVGNEDSSSYGLIDKAIQRDALTSLPCINSSSLKGAINEWSTQFEDINSEKRVSIFGSDKTKKNGKIQKGQYVFFDANILALPKQTLDGNMYKMVTGEKQVELLVNKLKSLGVEITAEDLKKQVNAEFDENFDKLCNDDNLPIIARNCLENGLSANLWYEQVLPAETVLLCVIDDKGDATLANKLKDNLVQIGANATIGYGYCKFENLK